MHARLRRFTLPVLLLAMQANLHADNEAWNQADLTLPKFDPIEVLDPRADPGAEWAQHLQADEPREAAAAFVRLLREGPARIDLDESIPAIRLRWFGTPINRISPAGFDPDDLVQLRYTGTYGITHQFEGAIDWSHDGSDGQTREWTWQLNRHFHWIDLADAYRKTGDKKYAIAWERELRGWIAQCPRPDDPGNRPQSAWRTLDTGIRAGSTWPYAFEVFRHSPHVSDEAIWLLFCAQRENALHLQKYPSGGNWKIMESNGLGHAGFMFPEMKDSRLFAETAVERHREEIGRQFFPDGTHQEFAPHYAAAGCITNFYALARIAEQKGEGLSEDFRDSLALMVSALGRIADPEGIVPAVHDSHVIDAKNMYEDVAAGHDPARYGTPPWSRPRSDLVPYGGYAVFRRDHSWALFNAGPRGTSHFHDDDLQLLTYAYGRHFAIDPASPNYTTEPISSHLRSSAAHNVVLMNGELHKPAVEISRPRQPMPLSFHGSGEVQAGAARRSFLQEDGSAFDHERTVLDVEGLGWVVLDRLFPPDEGLHRWEWVWNMPVDSVVTDESKAAAVFADGPAMVVACVSNADGGYTAVKGQEKPLRGWMNGRGLEAYLPIYALRYLTEEKAGPVWAVTLHAPFSEAVKAEAVGLTVSRESGDAWNVTAKRGKQTWQFRLAGDDEVRRIESWRNDNSIGSIAAGDHTLKE